MIHGEGVRLRALERGDVPLLASWMNDPEVRRGLILYAPISLIQEERWLENVLEASDDQVLAIEIEEAGAWRHIGNVGLHRIDWKNRSCIFGIVIGDKSSWGKGHGTAATRTTLGYAFGELNLHRVELEVFAFNERAMKVYERVGFRREGVRRKSHFHDGQYHDAHIMAILAEEFWGSST